MDAKSSGRSNGMNFCRPGANDRIFEIRSIAKSSNVRGDESFISAIVPYAELDRPIVGFCDSRDEFERILDAYETSRLPTEHRHPRYLEDPL